ncbi:MAG: damage-inducible protein DinB [Flavobacteriaceae bacterium CG_4_8_14_3_um_filter_34_10]|nr:DinB family protein [Flavobacteriia bacterium]OIP49315.1 MAG: damage-inducible protein DinB [Flavobacteriaceae bacterium CG2_30_34_30]PIQ17485.1 MAG: damage-inducible protein DinB [Flavobacteriaceae bacterium CG18_big_fil_WC_8_21_14_2_50_34_36]PIV50265.1 MAG: damage-inducible protein DinB [Flavobacteriaceae bacterium CG02_land_8_20_14_3_00_34_13]PIX10069.1 MAG: damage-inducible protein DinB [Flavobacteriaceae bacterium CG_4_8_14_3_um_filter_34_10]PIZ06842.1 MAG: damage-inducible protein Din
MFTSDLLDNEYVAFYGNYIRFVPRNLSLLDSLQTSFLEVHSFFLEVTEEKLHYRYAEGKWTLKEMLLHIIDTERIMSYRALRFGRKDTTPLAGFEQDDYVPNSCANERNIENLLEEYSTVRMATISLFASFNEVTLKQIGMSNGNFMSVRALGFIISGHEMHHLQVAKERYLP